jgi:ATP-dependent RNA helicase DDX23/PRP28
MTKKEREALALEKRNAEIAERQAKEKRDREEREKFERAAEEERKKADAARYGNGGPSNGGRCEQHVWVNVLLTMVRCERPATEWR